LKATERVFAILAVLVLLTQTVRHAYLLWFEPRVSVLDRYDHPLGNRISSAQSLAELVRLYDPVKREADRLQAAAAKDHPGVSPL
jgi:hypothetical protein